MSFAATTAVRLRWHCRGDRRGDNSLGLLLCRALRAVSLTVGDSTGASAPAAASIEAEDTLGAPTAAALASSGSSTGAPAVDATLLLDDWATWARQVEAEFAQVHNRLDDNFAELSAIASSSRQKAAACTDHAANFDTMVRQFMRTTLVG